MERIADLLTLPYPKPAFTESCEFSSQPNTMLKMFLKSKCVVNMVHPQQPHDFRQFIYLMRRKMKLQNCIA